MHIFFILVVFQVKHFLCDFPLQTRFMMRKFEPYPGFILPLAAHAGVHALATTALVLWINPYFWWLGIADFVCHFIVDRLKASPNLFGRWKPDNKFFWWALGFDQFLHHCWNYLMIVVLGVVR